MWSRRTGRLNGTGGGCGHVICTRGMQSEAPVRTKWDGHEVSMSEMLIRLLNTALAQTFTQLSSFQSNQPF